MLSAVVRPKCGQPSWATCTGDLAYAGWPARTALAVSRRHPALRGVVRPDSGQHNGPGYPSSSSKHASAACVSHRHAVAAAVHRRFLRISHRMPQPIRTTTAPRRIDSQLALPCPGLSNRPARSSQHPDVFWILIHGCTSGARSCARPALAVRD